MTRSLLFAALLAGASIGLASTAQADDYKVDDGHSSVLFSIQHLGAANVWGRFNAVDGDFTIDAKDPAKSSFNVTIDASSVDTNNEKRDKHLRNADFFNVEEFPKITFASKSVKKLDGDKWQVTGDLTFRLAPHQSVLLYIQDKKFKAGWKPARISG